MAWNRSQQLRHRGAHLFLHRALTPLLVHPSTRLARARCGRAPALSPSVTPFQSRTPEQVSSLQARRTAACSTALWLHKGRALHLVAAIIISQLGIQTEKNWERFRVSWIAGRTRTRAHRSCPTRGQTYSPQGKTWKNKSSPQPKVNSQK